jgi:hypothetical protein
MTGTPHTDAPKQRAGEPPIRRRRPSPPGRRSKTPRIVAAVVAVAVVAGVIVWLIARGGGTSTPPASTSTTTTTTSVTPLGPVVATRSALVAFSAALHRPVYWMGPLAGYRYEFTETTSGDIYVRYLPKGVRVGDPRAAFRIIATDPFPGALAALRAVAKGKGRLLKGGAIVVASVGHPKSMHIAYPGVGYEIEVYDPTPGGARTIALSGRVRPVG